VNRKAWRLGQTVEKAKHRAKAPSPSQALLPRGPSSVHRWLLQRAFEPVDVASLAFFRIAFGAILLWEVLRYFTLGWIELTFLSPKFRFTYHGAEWLTLWPGPGLYLHFVVLGGLAFLVLVGFWYRGASVLLWLAFTYVALLDKTQYLNHFYLVSLLGFLLIFVPANRAWSLDAYYWPHIASDTAPAWSLAILRFQVAVPYVFGGLAKLNADWLAGQPMQLWMSRMEHVREWVPWFGEHWLALVFSYGGLVLDLAIVPLLVWRRTRAFAFAWAVAFHVMNSIMFQIGIFPWLMIAATTLFFEPDWPRRVVAWLVPPRRAARRKPVKAPTGGRGELPATSARALADGRDDSPNTLTTGQLYVVALLAFYVALQILLPFRHFHYPGPVDWTEEGTLFAWRMMLNDKQAAVQFVAVDRTTRKKLPVDPRPFLIRHQIDRMARDPEMLREFAAYLKGAFRTTGHGDLEIHVVAFSSLNGRRPQLLVDPQIDLGSQPRRWDKQPYIMPLVEPRLDPPWNVPPDDWPEHVKIPAIE
jgi:hypothetical protein